MVLASSFHLERVPAAPLAFGSALGLDPLYSHCSLKPWLFSLCLRTPAAGEGQGSSSQWGSRLAINAQTVLSMRSSWRGNVNSGPHQTCDLERVPEAAPAYGRVPGWGLAPLYSRLPPSVLFLPTAGCGVGGGESLHYRVSVSRAILSGSLSSVARVLVSRPSGLQEEPLYHLTQVQCVRAGGEAQSS